MYSRRCYEYRQYELVAMLIKNECTMYITVVATIKPDLILCLKRYVTQYLVKSWQFSNISNIL